MSLINQNILQKIECTLDNINSLLSGFQSIDVVETKEEEIETSSNLKRLFNKTKHIYKWAIDNGSFHNTNHSNHYKDILIRWLVLIDDIHWAIFGYESEFETNENNKLTLINLKLQDIKHKVQDFIPTLC